MGYHRTAAQQPALCTALFMDKPPLSTNTPLTPPLTHTGPFPTNGNVETPSSFGEMGVRCLAHEPLLSNSCC